MQYELIAIDLDDTLLDKRARLSERTISTIRSIEKLGTKVIIATGRMLVSAMPYIKQLSLTGPMVTYNGAYIKDISTGKLLYQQNIDKTIAKEIIDFAAANDLHINLYQDDRLFVAERNEETDLYEKITGVQAEVVGSLNQFVEEEPTKLIIIEKDLKKYQYYMNILKERYKEKITITKSKNYFMEFMALGVSKAKGLAIIADYLGIERKKIIAIGDSWNDLEMINWSGLGITMHDSDAAIKEKADMIAPSNDQDGVARVLEEIFQLQYNP